MSCSLKEGQAGWLQSVRFWNFVSYTKFPRVKFHNLVGFFKVRILRIGTCTPAVFGPHVSALAIPIMPLPS